MSCAKHPPPKGWKCLDCWGCEWPPGTTRGTCSKEQLVGPDKSITNCKAGGTKAKPLFPTKQECIKNCGNPPGVTCYMCNISPGEKKGSCVTVHPSQGGKPLKTCPNWPNIFPTMEKCRSSCQEDGPVKPVAKCWQAEGPDCDCVLGDAEGPDGPLSSCDPNMGFYNTQSACSKACEKPDSRGSKEIWIIIGISVGVLFLLLIVGLIIYFLEKKRKNPY